MFNDVIHRALVKAGVPSIKEPAGLLRTDGKRPDGCSLIPWASGKCLAWDVTGPDTLAPSHLPSTSSEAGAAAESAARLKNLKYVDISRSHIFTAIAIESLGPLNKDGQALIADLGRRLSVLSGDPRETSFIFQRLSITVQRCNAAAFAGSFIAHETQSGTH
jgi:hypothetical protein